MPTTWILIADGARARVLEQDKDYAALEPAFGNEELPAGTTAQSKEIASDRPGRSFDSGGEGRHAMEPSTDPQRYAKYEFARDLAELLEKAANEHRFERLVLVAAPKALGDLRELLPKTVRGKVTAEIDKDLTNVPRQELPKHLAEVLKFPR